MSALEKAHELRDVDLSTAARGVWLVKVPKYLSEKWREAAGTGEVGKLCINKPRFPGGKPEVMLSLSDHLVHSRGSSSMGGESSLASAPVPKDHKFVMTGITSQQLSVLAQHADGGNIGIEGKVIQRAECRPLGDSSYMKLKKLQMESYNKPGRELVRLDKVVQNYKPTAYHSSHFQESRKKETEKRSRLDKEAVHEMLFNAFEKHQYYNVKDLVRITQQPITYLKEILNEICTYNMRAPHKNMWELKPEYRHYKDDEKTS